MQAETGHVVCTKCVLLVKMDSYAHCLLYVRGGRWESTDIIVVRFNMCICLRWVSSCTIFAYIHLGFERKPTRNTVGSELATLHEAHVNDVCKVIKFIFSITYVCLRANEPSVVFSAV